MTGRPGLGCLPAPLLLGAFVIWDVFEHWASERNKKRYRPFPLPSPEERRYKPSDVSIIIPTVDTDPSFSSSICRLLESRPREIILVAIEKEEHKVQALVDIPRVEASRGGTILKLLSIPHPNKRDQLVRGINESKGKILALVDDDAFWGHPEVLLHLLAPFQQEDVGLAGGPITSYLPDDRKSPDVITPWEVAAIRLRGKRHGSMKSAYAADGGINFSVSGVTALLRGEILRDPAFQHAFVNDVWMGHRQNSGDDSFITRWVLFHHLIGCQHQEDGLVPTKWRLGMQLTTEAEVGTSIMPDSRFAGQVKRWYRSGLRHRLMCLCFEPGIREMWRTCPYMTRKMVEGMLNPVLLWVRLYCLYKTALIYPWVALPILGIKLYRYINGVRGFARECPWARRCLWAAVLIDRLYLVSDWYCWATLGTEAWMSRRKVDEENDIALSDTSDEKEE